MTTKKSTRGDFSKGSNHKISFKIRQKIDFLPVLLENGKKTISSRAKYKGFALSKFKTRMVLQ